MADAIGLDERLELPRNKLFTIVTNDMFTNSKSVEKIALDFDGWTWNLEMVELTAITSAHLLCALITT